MANVMDSTLVKISILILLAAAIAAVGVQFGDQIEASLPGGKATGIVAGVALLIGLFVSAYKSISGIEKNVLDNAGLKYLLELHFGSVSHQLLHVIAGFIAEMEKSEQIPSADVFLLNCKRVIDNARYKLALFRTADISNIPEYLNQCLPQEQLEQHINKGLEIIQRAASPEEKNKLAYQLIQSVQADLWKRLNI